MMNATSTCENWTIAKTASSGVFLAIQGGGRFWPRCKAKNGPLPKSGSRCAFLFRGGPLFAKRAVWGSVFGWSVNFA